MKVLDRVGTEIKPGDFVVYVTAGDRHPVLEFGWVLEFRESKDSYSKKGTGNFKIKIQRATPNGTRQTVEAIDVPGHWRDDTPTHIISGRKPDGSWYHRTHDEWEQFYVSATYRDTGKPSTTSLDVSVNNDGATGTDVRTNNRLLVTQPV